MKHITLANLRRNLERYLAEALEGEVILVEGMEVTIAPVNQLKEGALQMDDMIQDRDNLTEELSPVERRGLRLAQRADRSKRLGDYKVNAVKPVASFDALEYLLEERGKR